MKPILLSGGPVEGVVEPRVASRDGRLWTVKIVHGNCSCDWCATVESDAVVHIYERRDDDVFVYRVSRKATDADA